MRRRGHPHRPVCPWYLRDCGERPIRSFGRRAPSVGRVIAVAALSPLYFAETSWYDGPMIFLSTAWHAAQPSFFIIASAAAVSSAAYALPAANSAEATPTWTTFIVSPEKKRRRMVTERTRT